MKKISTHGALQGIAFLIICASLASCGQGPGEDEFVQACLHGPRQQGNEAMCKCGASAAHEALSAKEFQAMVLDMQGKTAEEEKLLGNQSFDERANLAAKQFEVLSKCLSDQ